MLQQLAQHHDITLLAFADGTADDTDRTTAANALGEYCSVVRVVPYRAYRAASPKALAGLFSIQPRSLVDTYSVEMRDLIAAECERRRFDVVVASQLGMAPYAVGLTDVPTVLEEVEVSVFKDARQDAPTAATRLRASLTWLKLTAYLRRILPRFAACTVVSQVEKANLRTVAPGYHRVHVIPNAIDSARYARPQGSVRPNTLVFAGALTYQPNYDAARYFLADVYPTIRRSVPDLLLRITGSTTGVNLTALPPQPGLEYTGYVADIRPFVSNSWASVVPLRHGGGTRVKVLESMALGTPVVSTSKGVEGLEVTDGENVLVADCPNQFASRVVDLLRSPEQRARLAAGGRRLVEDSYDVRVMGQGLRALIEAVAA
jgi:glycosyltransferase involved in cell wall biosynthesis